LFAAVDKRIHIEVSQPVPFWKKKTRTANLSEDQHLLSVSRHLARCAPLLETWQFVFLQMSLPFPEAKPENQVRAAGSRDWDFLGIRREEGKAGALGKPGRLCAIQHE
jgi:hypothetical protein